MATKAELEEGQRALQSERDALALRLALYAQVMTFIVRVLKRAQTLDEGEEAPTLGLDQAERYDAAIEEVVNLIGTLLGGGAASPLEGALLVTGYCGPRVFPRGFAIYRVDDSGNLTWWAFCELPEGVEALLRQEGYRCVLPIRDQVWLGLYLKEAAEGEPDRP